MIRAAINTFPKKLDTRTIEEKRIKRLNVVDCTGQLMTLYGFVKVQLLPGQKNYGQQHINIWYNADDATTMGGRSVEIGYGPNYYTTYNELVEAIESALNSNP